VAARSVATGACARATTSDNDAPADNRTIAWPAAQAKMIAADATVAAVASTTPALPRVMRDSRKWAATAATTARFGNDDAAT